VRGWGLGTRLYCDREDSDRIKNQVLLFIYTFATLQHLEQCGVTTYQHSKASFLKLQCWLDGRTKHCIMSSRVVLFFTMHADVLQLLWRGGQCDDHEFLGTVFKFAEQD